MKLFIETIAGDLESDAPFGQEPVWVVASDLNGTTLRIRSTADASHKIGDEINMTLDWGTE